MKQSRIRFESGSRADSEQAENKTVNYDALGYEMKFAIAASGYDPAQYNEIYYFDFDFNEFNQDNCLEDNPPIDQFDVDCGVWGFTVYRIK